MEIELSWPSWLQKVVLIHFIALLLLSTTQKILASSMLSTDISRTQSNSSALNLEALTSSNLSTFIEGSEGSTESQDLRRNQDLESQILEKPQKESYKEVSLGEDESSQDGVTDYAFKLEDSDIGAGTDEWLRISVLNMIMTRDEVAIDDNSIIYNETFWLSLDCDDFWKLEPPPSFIEFIPPPPIPPFLREHEITFKEGRMEKEENENAFEDGEPQNEIIFDDQFCSLCSWANEAVNLTAVAINVPKKDSKTGVNGVMVGVLVGVALLSAAIGAAIMGIFLKCRKRESSTMDRGFCPLVVRSRWLNSSPQKSPTSNLSTGTESSNNRGGPQVTNDQQIMSVSFGMTRCNSTSPLQTTSPASENSGQSEDHYISAETSSSVVYAELANSNQNHHYSEIEEIYHLPNLVANAQENFMDDETYENFGYILPEISSVRVAGGSPLYSPSAYYSDVSLNGIYLVNRNTNSDNRNRKKRKRNAKCNSSRVEAFGDGCHACAQPRSQCHNLASGSGQNFSRPCDTKLNNSINQCQEIPPHNRTNLETTFPFHRHPEGIYRVHLNSIQGSPSFSNIPSCNNNDDPMWHVYELQTLRCSNPQARRSLPPLPKSRVPNSFRKQLRSCRPHHISSVPSEYI